MTKYLKKSQDKMHEVVQEIQEGKFKSRSKKNNHPQAGNRDWLS